MEDEILEVNTPVYVFNDIQQDGLSICSLVCELPGNKLFLMLEQAQIFHEAITQQLQSVLITLQGHIVPNTIQNSELKFPLTSGHDLMLLQYHKHYKGSTETVAIGITDKITNVASKYNDNLYTNKMFKKNTITKKLDIKLHMKDGLIKFGYHGELTLNDSDESEILKKIYV